MWIFLNDSFLSVVADKADPRGNRLLVLARRSSDHAQRAGVPRQQVAEALAARVEAIDYPNFKNTIQDIGYHDAAMQVWGVMHRLQQRSG